MSVTDYNARLYEKMKAEQDKYRGWLLHQEPSEILNHTYEYTMREDIVMCMEELELEPEKARALLRSPCPLSDVYKEFRDRETEHILQKGEIILFEGCKSVLLADTYGIHNTGAILTSHLNPNQMKLLAALGCRVVFALDKDVCIRDDHNIKRLKQFVNVQYLWDKDNLLGEKDSPVDRGQETWKKLYEGRLSWR